MQESRVVSAFKHLAKSILVGLCVALVLARLYPNFAHCLKHDATCPLVLVVFNLGVFWTTIVFWPLVLAGILVGKLTCWVVWLVV
jgi:hypothetical protein